MATTVAAAGTEGEADAKLAAAAADGVGDDAVEAEARQGQGEKAEDGEEGGAHSRRVEGDAHEAGEGGGLGEGELGVQLEGEAPELADEREGVAGLGRRQEVAVGLGALAAGEVDHRPWLLPDRAHLGVRGDAHHLGGSASGPPTRKRRPTAAAGSPQKRRAMAAFTTATRGESGRSPVE
jgi:hypothetical protein